MAANAVFNTYELVLLIAPHLDELSLVRMQGVNQTSRNVASAASIIGHFCADVSSLRLTKVRHCDAKSA